MSELMLPSGGLGAALPGAGLQLDISEDEKGYHINAGE